MTEINPKLTRIQDLLNQRGLDALLLRRVSSFAWATCGAASYVNTATADGDSALLIKPTERYLITNNIEAPRLMDEEGVVAQGWQVLVTPWNEPSQVVEKLTEGLRLGADGPYPGAENLAADLARMRSLLTPEEGERMRRLGRLCADAMESAIRAVKPGQTEYEIAGILAGEAESRGVQAIVNLIATDERIFAFRHPLPSDKRLDRYAMLVLCGRRQGLVCSVTRLVHFGRLPDELRFKSEAVAHVDGVFITASQPGKTLAQVFDEGISAYAHNGFPDEWRLHHQGGLAGYEPRELVATASSLDRIAAGQAFAWNPSITGTKSEDTILVGEQSNEVVTPIADWPMITVDVAGQTIERPAILEVT
ncbi:MAG: M24 family metallopeptidase [Chloroflexota bacterium]|nr:M24 family metallopeptidase [Chloroflexota bacterium]